MGEFESAARRIAAAISAIMESGKKIYPSEIADILEPRELRINCYPGIIGSATTLPSLCLLKTRNMPQGEDTWISALY